MEAGPPFSLHSTIQASMLNTLGARGRFIVHRIRVTNEASQGRYKKVFRECPGSLSGKVQKGSQGSYRKVIMEGTGRFSGKIQ